MNEFNDIIERIRNGEITAQNAHSFVNPFHAHQIWASVLTDFASDPGKPLLPEQHCATLALAAAHLERLIKTTSPLDTP